MEPGAGRAGVRHFLHSRLPPRPTAGVASADTVAVVEGQEIRADEFRRTYQAQLQAYRQAYGGKMNEQLLKQLGVDQQILQQMVDERAALAEAERLGIRVSDEEVAQRIYAIPAFQENGAFIGGSATGSCWACSARRSLEEFEDSVRRSLTVDKLRTSLTEWLSLPEKDLEEEYRRRNEKVKLAVVTFLPRASGPTCPRPTRKSPRTSTRTRRSSGSRRSGRSATCWWTSRRCARRSSSAGRHRARLQREHRAVLDARPGPRQPHPPEDRRQGRGGRESAGRGRS